MDVLTVVVDVSVVVVSVHLVSVAAAVVSNLVVCHFGKLKISTLTM